MLLKIVPCPRPSAGAKDSPRAWAATRASRREMQAGNWDALAWVIEHEGGLYYVCSSSGRFTFCSSLGQAFMDALRMAAEPRGSA